MTEAKKDCYIIGGGMSGLIASYLTGYRIISTDLGGEWGAKADFPLGPRILRVGTYARVLLESLSLPVNNIKTHNVGYIDGPKLLSTPSSTFRGRYHNITRGHPYFSDSSMNDGATFIKGYDVHPADVVEALHEKIPEMWLGKVTRVNPTSRTIHAEREDEGREVIHYDRLISTIDLSRFMQTLGGCSLPIKNSGIHFTLVRNESVSYDYDFIYCVGQMYHRITRFGEHGYVFESNEDIRRAIEDKGWEVSGYVHLPNIRIIHDWDVRKVAEVDMLGRYAQRKHSVRLEHVIERCLDDLGGEWPRRFGT